MTLGRPRLHLRLTDSTNLRARDLALHGAPHGTLVTAREQTAGRGRQGRTWSAPPGHSLLMSLIVRRFDALLPLRAGLAVADVAGPQAQLKWPNDVWLEGRKVSGILVEGRPQEGWAVIGIGLNVAVDLADLPPEVQEIAATMGRVPEDVEAVLCDLLTALERRLAEDPQEVIAAVRARDALRGRRIAWRDGEGEAAGIDDHGSLLVRTGAGDRDPGLSLRTL